MSEEDYHKNTAKYMVTEKGKMPYDSRLVEDTIVYDDYDPRKERMQWDSRKDIMRPIEIYTMPTDESLPTYEIQRLDHEWQKKWFQENGDLNIRIKKRKMDGSNDNIILSQIQKYRDDLGNFHRNDETYKMALEESMKKDKERNELSRKRNDIRKALENNTLRSISIDDANKLGWIIENDPKYKLYKSSKRDAQYVYPNEYVKKFTGEEVLLSDKPIWLGKTVIDEKNSKKGGKQHKSRKMKKTRKSRKMKKNKKSNKSKRRSRK